MFNNNKTSLLWDGIILKKLRNMIRKKVGFENILETYFWIFKNDLNILFTSLLTDYKSGFGGQFGVHKGMDKSAAGWDHIEKVEKHDSQKGLCLEMFYLDTYLNFSYLCFEKPLIPYFSNHY